MDIRMVDVVKRFGDTVAVTHINLHIKFGQLVVFLGPSGCGKTTLLRLIAGLEGVTSGQIFLGEKNVTHAPPQERNISMVFQDLALYPHMTTYKNISFALESSRRFTKDQIQKEVSNVAGFLGIKDLLHRSVTQLSGGESQRVALARALVRQPVAFLLDEAFSNLDAVLKRRFRAEFKRIQRKLGITMIHVTHDQEEAMTMGDRIVLMKNGRIVQDGTPEDLFDRPLNLFAARFIGSPPMNTFSCEIDRENEKIVAFCNGFNVELRDPAVVEPSLPLPLEGTIGIRPQYITWDYEDRAGRGIRCKIEVVEPIGTEKIVHCFINDQEVIAVFPSQQDIKEGSNIFLYFDPSMVQIFAGRDDEANLIV